MRVLLKGLMASCMMIASGPANAQEILPDAGGWSMIRGEDRCLTNLEYEGHGSTSLSVTLEVDGESIFIVSNANWSAIDGQKYPNLRVELDQRSYVGGAVGQVGSDYRPGLTMRMPFGFLDAFSRGTSLKIYNDDVLVDSLDLTGSSAAVASLRRCITVVQRRKQAEDRERRRWEHIPVDPFAVPSTKSDLAPLSIISDPQWSRPPRPTEADFPQRALDRRVGGSATVQCAAQSSCRPVNCTVVSESPAGMGFGAAAVRIVQRGQLSPRTVDGAAQGATFVVTIPFDLPTS